MSAPPPPPRAGASIIRPGLRKAASEAAPAPPAHAPAHAQHSAAAASDGLQARSASGVGARSAAPAAAPIRPRGAAAAALAIVPPLQIEYDDAAAAAAASRNGGYGYDGPPPPALPPPPATRGAAARQAAASSSSSSSLTSSGYGGLPALEDEGGGGAGSDGGAVVPRGSGGVLARPVAVTKHGLRQFVETGNGLRMFIQNCVSSCNLQCKLDLAHITTHARNVEYNPRRFTGAILRVREPRSTVLLFTTGKMVVTGTKSEDDARTVARKVAKITQKLGFPVSFTEFKVQNMVATGDTGFPIRLEGLAAEQRSVCSYEPELFPGLIYRMPAPRVVVLIFVSGKIVITGARTRSTILQATETIYPLLYRYRKGAAAAAAAAAGGGAASGAGMDAGGYLLEDGGGGEVDGGFDYDETY